MRIFSIFILLDSDSGYLDATLRHFARDTPEKADALRKMRNRNLATRLDIESRAQFRAKKTVFIGIKSN